MSLKINTTLDKRRLWMFKMQGQLPSVKANFEKERTMVIHNVLVQCSSNLSLMGQSKGALQWIAKGFFSNCCHKSAPVAICGRSFFSRHHMFRMLSCTDVHFLRTCQLIFQWVCWQISNLSWLDHLFSCIINVPFHQHVVQDLKDIFMRLLKSVHVVSIPCKLASEQTQITELQNLSLHSFNMLLKNLEHILAKFLRMLWIWVTSTHCQSIA